MTRWPATDSRAATWVVVSDRCLRMGVADVEGRGVKEDRGAHAKRSVSRKCCNARRTRRGPACPGISTHLKIPAFAGMTGLRIAACAGVTTGHVIEYRGHACAIGFTVCGG